MALVQWWSDFLFSEDGSGFVSSSRIMICCEGSCRGMSGDVAFVAMVREGKGRELVCFLLNIHRVGWNAPFAWLLLRHGIIMYKLEHRVSDYRNLSPVSLPSNLKYAHLPSSIRTM